MIALRRKEMHLAPRLFDTETKVRRVSIAPSSNVHSRASDEYNTAWHLFGGINAVHVAMQASWSMSGTELAPGGGRQDVPTSVGELPAASTSTLPEAIPIPLITPFPSLQENVSLSYSNALQSAYIKQYVRHLTSVSWSCWALKLL